MKWDASQVVGFIALIAIALCGTSCAARPKTYAAPDASKVTATTKRLSAAIAKANETALLVEAKAQEAQESYDRVAGHSASVLQLIQELEPFIPADPAHAGRRIFDELKSSADAQIVEEGKLSTALAGTRDEIGQLKKDQAVVVQEKEQLQRDQAKYQAAAQRIADAATEESRQKVEYKKQLTSQKILKWLWRIGGGTAVLVIVALFVTGKISFAAIRAYFGR